MSDAADILYGAPAQPPTPPSVPAKSAAETLYCQTPESATPPAPAPTPPAPAPVPVTPPAADASTAKPGVGPADAAAVLPDALANFTPADITKAIPVETLEARKADTGRTLYGDLARDAIAESFAFEDVPGMQPETLAAVKTELANMAIDAGANQADVDVLRTAIAEANANPLTDVQRIASRDACIEAFNSTYGENATRTLEITRTWIQQDPRRHAFFAQVGDDPRAALLAARLALASKFRR